MCKDVTPLNHYRSKQSYGKDLKKSLGSLPSSPQKRTSVMAGLAKQAGLKLECQMGKKTRWNPSKEVEIYPAIKGHKCSWYALNITKHYIK